MARQLAIEAAMMAGIGLVLALMGPFETGGLPFALRLIDWQVFMFGGYVVFRPVVNAGSLAAQHGGLPRWLGIALAVLLASMPVTLLVAWALGGMAWHWAWHWAWQGALRGLTLETLVALYPDIVLVGALVTGLQLMAARRREEPVGEPVERPVARPASGDLAPLPSPVPEDGAEPVRLLARLGAVGAGDILALESEDHYVRVHTRSGSTLLLLRLADAIAELDGIDGARTHRSWWVARGAVAEVVRRNRAVSLRLVNGIEAPVARNAVSDLRAAGWLGR